MRTRNERYLIDEKPIKALWMFSLPLIIGNLFQQTYTMVDSMIVGRFVGENALAAIGASYAFTNIFIWLAIGGGIGASVVVSRHFGSRSFRSMKTAIYTALLSFLGISIVLAGAGLASGRAIMVFLKTPEDVLTEAVIYLNIYFCGLPFLFMYNVLSAMFSAMGKSKLPLYFLVFSSLFNIWLDVVLVTRAGMGIAGVAYATLIAQGLSALISLFTLLRMIRGYYERAGEKTQLFSMSEAVAMSRIAVPSIFQQATVAIGMMFVQSVVNRFGAQALAGFSAAARVENFICGPWSAFNNAMSTYTAQNLGAGKRERVRQGFVSVHKLVAVFGVLFFIILRGFPEQIIEAFLGDNMSAEACLVGAGYVRFLGLVSWMLGVKMMVDGTLRGNADTRSVTIGNFVNLGLRVLISFTCAPVFGVAFVWYASPVGWLVSWIISYPRYRRTLAAV